mmetsp:Transcript_2753/g.8581  ORF Transcript_2753/g.8581 Transcript_2753/m.8581 type:complete len:289 (-) Transcript_2753:217-1083(-)
MAAGRLPGRAGPVLLRRWRRPLLWPLHLRGALQGLPLRRHRHLGHQRRGDAWPVGVPGWAVRWHRRGRRADGLALHLAARVRGFRRLLHLRPEAHRRRLERRRLPHQLLHREDAQGWRPRRHRHGHPPAGRAPLGPHRRVRRGQRAPADRQARDGRHEHLLVRRRQPRLLDPHPPLRRGGRLRLPRGPPPVLQHGPVRGHVDDLRDDRRGQRGARRPGVVRRARLGGPTRLWPRFLWSPPPPRPSPPSTPTTSPPPPPPPGRGCARAAFGLTSERARISPVLGRRASG